MAWAAKYPWPGNVRQLRHSLAKWLVYRGTKSLASVVAEGEQDEATMRTAASPASVLSQAVFDALERARLAGAALCQTVGDFQKTFATDAKRAIARWFHDCRPTNDELEAMFTGQSSNNIRTTVGRWGEE